MLGDITIGRYIAKNSPLHSSDARTKIIAAAIFTAAVFACNSLFSLALLLLFCAAAACVSKIPVKYALSGLKPLRWFILFTIIVNLFFGGGNVLLSVWVLHITDTGIITAIKAALKFILLIGGTSLLTLTTSPIALTDGIARLIKPLNKIKIPADAIAMMISITLRFIPMFADEAEKIMKAQRARGADFGGGIKKKLHSALAITIPLFISVFRRADELALAMDSRCYGAGKRAPRHKSEFSKNDMVIMLIMLALCTFLALIEFLH